MDKKRRPETKVNKAIHKQLEKEWDQEYLAGSLYELEMIGGWFEGTDDVTLYLLNDEFEPFIPDQNDDSATNEKEVLIPGEDEKYERAFNATTNEKVFINTDHRAELRASAFPFENSKTPREFRRLKHFFAKMKPVIMYKVCNERDFIERYCYLKMRWNGREIEQILFNKKSRKIYFQLKPNKLRIDISPT